MASLYGTTNAPPIVATSLKNQIPNETIPTGLVEGFDAKYQAYAQSFNILMTIFTIVTPINFGTISSVLYILHKESIVLAAT